LFSGLPQSSEKALSEEDKTPIRVSHSLTVASANIFLLMKKESN
jgi:hypothetical protein